MSANSYSALRRTASRLGLSGDDVAELLESYAAGLEEAEPQAIGEIDAATNIGLNIRDILEFEE